MNSQIFQLEPVNTFHSDAIVNLFDYENKESILVSPEYYNTVPDVMKIPDSTCLIFSIPKKEEFEKIGKELNIKFAHSDTYNRVLINDVCKELVKGFSNELEYYILNLQDKKRHIYLSKINLKLSVLTLELPKLNWQKEYIEQRLTGYEKKIIDKPDSPNLKYWNTSLFTWENKLIVTNNLYNLINKISTIINSMALTDEEYEQRKTNELETESPKSTSNHLVTKTDLLANTTKLSEWMGFKGFFELPKVMALSEKGKDELLILTVTSKLPYQIAMLFHLGFIDKLIETIPTKTKLYSELAKGINNGKNLRGIEGNIRILSGRTNESKSSFTSHNYTITVKDDYNRLLSI